MTQSPEEDNEASLALREALAERYQILREIGRGGTATVWLAEGPDGSRVAVKVLQSSIARALGTDRFLREIHIAASITEPRLVPLLAWGEAGGVPYYIMPFIEGGSLRERIAREGQLPIASVVRIARGIAEGLAVLHHHGIVHRDIKPANVLLEGTTGLDPMVADYGIARAITASALEPITSTGIVLGTPPYMSPEQATGASVDRRSDLYAWGCVVYEMLAGEPPFHGITAQAVIARHLHEPPPSLRVVRRGVPDALEDLVVRALAKAPADRPENAEAIIAALDSADLSVVSTSITRPIAARLRALWIGAGTAVLAVAALAWWQLERRVTLDGDRVVVFPFADRRTPGGEGEQLAILIGSALERTEPMRWLDGWSLLNPGERDDPRELSPRRARSLARDQHARWFLIGSMIPADGTLRAVVELHDAGAGTLVSRETETGPAGAPPVELVLAAVTRLLPRLTGAERGVDLTALKGRRPAAVANWLQGEREYRRSRMASAHDLFERASTEDSSLSVAALRAAITASWLGRSEDARGHVGQALAHPEGLSPRSHTFALALERYLNGRANESVRHLRHALAIDPDWVDAWMLAGEVYLHLVPSEPLDSLALHAVPAPAAWPLEVMADQAFRTVRRLDPGFTPPLAHLTEIALRRGELKEAARFVTNLTRAGPDSARAQRLERSLRCVEQGAVALQHAEPAELFALGVSLAAASYLPARACAAAAFRAVLARDTTLADEDWSSLVALQSMLVAENHGAEAIVLVDSALAGGLNAALGLYVLDEIAGAGTGTGTARFAAQLDSARGSRGAPSLWLLTHWHAHRGEWTQVAEIARIAVSRTVTRLDSLVAAVALAYDALGHRDTALAIGRFAALEPTATTDDVGGALWEGLAPERVTEGELLLARGERAAAHRALARVDHPGIPINQLFLARSLELRMRAATELGDSSLVEAARARLRSLGRSRRRRRATRRSGAKSS